MPDFKELMIELLAHDGSITTGYDPVSQRPVRRILCNIKDEWFKLEYYYDTATAKDEYEYMLLPSLHAMHLKIREMEKE